MDEQGMDEQRKQWCFVLAGNRQQFKAACMAGLLPIARYSRGLYISRLSDIRGYWEGSSVDIYRVGEWWLNPLIQFPEFSERFPNWRSSPEIALLRSNVSCLPPEYVAAIERMAMAIDMEREPLRITASFRPQTCHNCAYLMRAFNYGERDACNAFREPHSLDQCPDWQERVIEN